jgi:hypothetical protein
MKGTSVMIQFLQRLVTRRGRTYRFGDLAVAERDLAAIGKLFV